MVALNTKQRGKKGEKDNPVPVRGGARIRPTWGRKENFLESYFAKKV